VTLVNRLTSSGNSEQEVVYCSEFFRRMVHVPYMLASSICVLLIPIYLLSTTAKGSNDFNYDINDRVQDNIRSFLLGITEAGIVPFYQLQSGFIPLDMINGTELGWDYGSALLFNTKRVYHNEMIAITLGGCKLSTRS